MDLVARIHDIYAAFGIGDIGTILASMADDDWSAIHQQIRASGWFPQGPRRAKRYIRSERELAA